MTPDEAAEQFSRHLRQLHLKTGKIPYRLLGERAGISHGPISQAMNFRSGARLPRWPTLAPVIEVLGGDEQVFLDLWVAAEAGREQIPRPEEAAEDDYPETAGDEVPNPEPTTVEEAQSAQEDLNTLLRQQEQEQRSLQEQLRSAQEERADLTAKIYELTRQVEQLKCEADLDVGRRDDLNAQISDLNARIEALRSENELLLREIRELRAKLSQYQEEKIQLLEQKLRIARRQWQLAWRYPSHEVRALTGHTQGVLRVAFSPDGKLIATADRAGPDTQDPVTVRLWETATGTQIRIHTLTAHHRHSSTRIAFSPGGKLLAGADENGNVHVWNTATGALERELSHHCIPWMRRNNFEDPGPMGIYDLAFDRAGELLATAGGVEGSVRVWDISTGQQAREPIVRPDTRTAYPLSVMFAPDGTLLAAIKSESSMFGELRLGDLAANERLPALASFTPGTCFYYKSAFSPDGRLVAACSCDYYTRGTGKYRVQVWDAETRDLIATFISYTYIPDIAFSPDNRLIAAAGVGEISAQLWEIATGEVLGEVLHSITGYVQENIFYLGLPVSKARYIFRAVNAVAFSPDGRQLATAGDDCTVRLWS